MIYKQCLSLLHTHIQPCVDLLKPRITFSLFGPEISEGRMAREIFFPDTMLLFNTTFSTGSAFIWFFNYDVLPFVQVDHLPPSLLSLQQYPVKDKVVTSQLPAVVQTITKRAVIIIKWEMPEIHSSFSVIWMTMWSPFVRLGWCWSAFLVLYKWCSVAFFSLITNTFHLKCLGELNSYVCLSWGLWCWYYHVITALFKSGYL